jgi:hypothetical protein
MSPGALRKAVERGQVPCQRIGNRLRFRRAELISQAPARRRPPVLLPPIKTSRRVA